MLFLIFILAPVISSLLCIGHRGIPVQSPENTIISLKTSLDFGADGIETDVRLTRDNQVIIMHDTTLDRTTNGTGLVRNVSSQYVNTLKTGGQSIPYLSQVLDLILEHPAKKLILDVKDDNPIEILTHIQSILSTYSAHKSQLLKQVYIGVWNQEFLNIANRLSWEWLKCFIGENAESSLRDVFIVSLNHSNLTREHVDVLHAQKLLVSAWTVNGPEAIASVKSLNVDIIISNDIRDCLQEDASRIVM